MYIDTSLILRFEYFTICFRGDFKAPCVPHHGDVPQIGLSALALRDVIGFPR